jgi:Zn-dependent alcohol dehydrogenase
VKSKQSLALEFGATHAFGNMDDATELARSVTNGQGADSCIVCVGVTTGQNIAQGVESIRKAGTCVITGMGRVADDTGIPISTAMFTLYQKRLQGSLFGASNPTKDIPLMLNLYAQGRLKLEELITQRYSLGEINEGYDDMKAGRNIRGVIILDH